MRSRVKQMPDNFFGPEIPLEGATNARLGELAIILQNGRFTRVVVPGKSFRRGIRAPFRGNLTFIQVNTGSVPYRFSESDVATSDDYRISVSVKVDVSLNENGDYAGLEGFLKTNQNDLSEALNGEIQRALERLIRETLGEHSHATLRKKSLSNLLHRSETFGQGVLKMVSLVVESVSWDPNALTMESLGKETEVVVAQTHAEGRVAEEKLLLEASLLDQRIKIFNQMSHTTGLPVAKLLPELFPEVRESRERAFALLSQFMQPDMFLKVSRHPELLTSLVTAAGLTGREAHLALQGSLPDNGRLLSSDNDTSVVWGDDTSTLSTMPIDVVTMTPAINYIPPDRRVRHVWDRYDLGELRGASVGVGSDRIIILAVIDPPVHKIRDAEILEQFSAMIGSSKNSQPRSVEVVALSSAVQDIKDLFQAWLDEVTDSSANIQVQEVVETGPNATILVRGQEGNGNNVVQEVRRLRGIDSPEMDSLEGLLSYSRIDLQVVG